MSRYLERAENTARVLEVNQTLLLDLDVPVEQQWRPLLIISGIHDMTGAVDARGGPEIHDLGRGQPEQHRLVAGRGPRERPHHPRGHQRRDVGTDELLLSMDADPPHASSTSRNRSEFYNQIKRINQLIHGISEGDDVARRGLGVLPLGKYLERACQTARILDVKYHILLPTPEHVGTPIDNAHWVAILTSCSGYEPYHKQRLSNADPGVLGGRLPDLRPLCFRVRCCRCLRQCAGGRPCDLRERNRPA